uniref:Protocadherin 1 gamma 13 n=2 Tax=Haplochromini TaxID=319058 RepID=A0A3Q2WNM2_HAPBU
NSFFLTMKWQALLFSLVFYLGPVIGQISYSIPEEMPSGSLVGNIAQDLGLDTKRLKSGRARVYTGDGVEYIELNGERGLLLIKERIDREALCRQTTPCALHFQIILENPMEFYSVTVEIIDINDNPPTFEKSEVTFKISESAVIGGKFVLDRAIDLDVGKNGLQKYELKPTDNFVLKGDSQGSGTEKAEMILQKPLDREKEESISLVLTAFDGGDPQMSGTIRIFITVLDVNDNAPVFTQSTYTATVFENAPEGTVVTSVSASDADHGSNGRIKYSITNKVIVIGQIDYEKTKLFQIDIEATDNGGLSDSSKILLDVTDVNDNSPQLKILSKSDAILEDSPESTVIAMLSVNDPDSDRNGEFLPNLTTTATGGTYWIEDTTFSSGRENTSRLLFCSLSRNMH